jgi:hypothetical protein
MWKTKKQTFVALSTIGSLVPVEAHHIPPRSSPRTLLAVLRVSGWRTQLLFTDRLNAYQTVANPLNKARTRCIDVEMAADGLTKPPLCTAPAASYGLGDLQRTQGFAGPSWTYHSGIQSSRAPSHHSNHLVKMSSTLHVDDAVLGSSIPAPLPR